MQLQFPRFAFIYLIAAALCFMSAVLLWKRRNNPGSTHFALFLLSLSIWSFASLFELGAITAEQKMFWSKWQYLGITTISPLWFIFTAIYTKRERIIQPKLRKWLWIVPIATLVLAFTNEYHGLVWEKIEVVHQDFYIGVYDHSYVFYIHLIYSYVLLLIVRVCVWKL